MICNKDNLYSALIRTDRSLKRWRLSIIASTALNFLSAFHCFPFKIAEQILSKYFWGLFLLLWMLDSVWQSHQHLEQALAVGQLQAAHVKTESKGWWDQIYSWLRLVCWDRATEITHLRCDFNLLKRCRHEFAIPPPQNLQQHPEREIMMLWLLRSLQSNKTSAIKAVCYNDIITRFLKYVDTFIHPNV